MKIETITYRTAGAAALVGLLAVVNAQQPPRIALREGLTIVTAINQENLGDFESIKVFTQVNDRIAQLKYSAEVPVANDDDNPLAAVLGRGGKQKSRAASKQVHHVRSTRTIARQDLKTAHEYRLHFHDDASEMFAGSTAVGVSAAVLSELKTKGETQLKVPAGGLVGALGGLVGGLLGGSAKTDEATMLSGTLKRVGTGAVPFKVLVNDQPAELPAIHARGRLDDDDAELWVLDDVENPLALKWAIGDDRLQVIKLSFPVETTSAATAGASSALGAASNATRIERDLEKTGRSVVYGIYFDFASDRIKEESEPVLEEIADAMTKNPLWKLNVEGHTDSIGGATPNLDLSRRRAAAVRQALIARYRVAADRLAPAGFGASRPKETNDTLEGRARNRRVELVRQ
jgi:OOP family OmpA-OmpF porin